MSDAVEPMADDKCGTCNGKRTVPDNIGLHSYPEQRPCPDCTGGSWAEADRLLARTRPPEAAGVTGAGDVDAEALELLAAEYAEAGLRCNVNYYWGSATTKAALAAIKSALARQQHAPRERRRVREMFDLCRHLSDSQFAEMASGEDGEELLGRLVGALGDALEPQSSIRDAALVEAAAVANTLADEYGDAWHREKNSDERDRLRARYDAVRKIIDAILALRSEPKP